MKDILTLREFKKNAQSGVSVRKAMATKAIQADADRTITFTITTDDIDRDLDRVILDGVDLTHYLKNPMVLWEHDHGKPVGRCIALHKAEGALIATVEFMPSDNKAFGQLADGIYEACRDGYLNATSIGFRVLDFELSTDEARGAGTYEIGADFLAIDLFEFSIVSVPANPYALIERPTTIEAEPKAANADVEKSAEELEPTPLEQLEPAENINISVSKQMHKSRRLRLLGI